MNQVETLVVKGLSGHRPNVGKMVLLFSNNLTEQYEETGPLPYDASAAEVRRSSKP